MALFPCFSPLSLFSFFFFSFFLSSRLRSRNGSFFGGWSVLQCFVSEFRGYLFFFLRLQNVVNCKGLGHFALLFLLYFLIWNRYLYRIEKERVTWRRRGAMKGCTLTQGCELQRWNMVLAGSFSPIDLITVFQYAIPGCTGFFFPSWCLRHERISFSLCVNLSFTWILLSHPVISKVRCIFFSYKWFEPLLFCFWKSNRSDGCSCCESSWQYAWDQ